MLVFDTFQAKEFERILSEILVNSNKDNTYKFAFAKFLLDYSRDNTDTHVDYLTIAEYFLKYYWPQTKLKIKQIPQAGQTLEIMNIIKDQFDDSYYNNTLSYVKRSEPEKIKKCIRQIAKKCFHNVTWRFQRVKIPQTAEIRAFFKYEIGREINRNRKFVDLNAGIDLNPDAMKFFKNHNKAMMIKVMQEWIRFLKKLNKDDVERIESEKHGSFYDVLRTATLKLPIDHAGLRMHVWECLTSEGRTMPLIKEKEHRHAEGRSDNQELQYESIWHTKTEVDALVASKLGIDVSLYGSDKSKNPLYKAVVNEISRLREKKILVDWDEKGDKKLGVGIWRLDEIAMNNEVYDHVEKEIRKGNFYSNGEMRTVYVRKKQEVFRAELLKDYEKCALCGFGIHDYVIGAHIVPYRIMRRKDPYNSMNPQNGLLLCRLCDVAFEKGFITIEQDFGVEISELLSENSTNQVRSWVSHVTPELRLRHDMKYPLDPKFLEWKLKLLQDRT